MSVELYGLLKLPYTSLKMAVLLHKTVLVNFPMATTVVWGLAGPSAISNAEQVEAFKN